MTLLREGAKTMVRAPRIKGIDATRARQLLRYNDRGRGEMLRELGERPGDGTQLTYAMLADYCYDLGLLYYAIGAPDERVYRYLTEAGRAYLRVFQLRGTQPAFRATLVELLPDVPMLPAVAPAEWVLGTRWTEASKTSLHLPREVDYSLTNSRTGLRAMYLGLITEQGLARKIAELVSDPVGASYIGTSSEVCTPNEQHAAYAMKAYVLNNSAEASRQLRLVEDPQKYLTHQAAMIQALIDRNPGAFLSGLDQLLSEHRRWTESDSHLVEGFLCMPGLGLSAAALLSGVIDRESLPAENVYLPLPSLPKPGSIG